MSIPDLGVDEQGRAGIVAKTWLGRCSGCSISLSVSLSIYLIYIAVLSLIPSRVVVNVTFSDICSAKTAASGSGSRLMELIYYEILTTIRFSVPAIYSLH